MEHLCSLLLKIVCPFIISAFVREGYKLFQPTSKANRSKSMCENDDDNTDSTIHDDNSSRKDEDSSSEISSMSTRSQKKLTVKIGKKTPNKLAPKDWFTCKDCKENLGMEEKIIDHCLVMHSQKIFVCTVEKCFKYFKSNNGLRVHWKDFHANVLKCHHCNKICTSYSNLNSHIDSFHVAAKYKCDHCGKFLLETVTLVDTGITRVQIIQIDTCVVNIVC